MSASGRWEERSANLITILSSQKVILRVMGASAAKDGITLQQFSVLRVLARAGPVPMNTLSKELGVSAPNITGVVDRLESKELVSRVSSVDDRRMKQIQLTPKGEASFYAVRKGYSESLQESLDALTPEEQEILAKLLRKLAREISEKAGDAGLNPKQTDGEERP